MIHDLSRLTAANESARLFFALWPSNDLRVKFQEWAKTIHRKSQGRIVSNQSLHLTLVFLGQVPIDRVAELKSVAGKVDAQAFELIFSDICFWHEPRVICARPRQPCEPLLRLVRNLESLLRNANLSLDKRSYQPHVTLMRNAYSQDDWAFSRPIEWKVDTFSLVRSNPGVKDLRYEVIEQWHLKNDPENP